MTDINDFKSSSISQANKYQLAFKRMPAVQYFCQKVTLPGLELSQMKQATPFRVIPIAGNRLEYTSFDISFLLDEEYVSWYEIFIWMHSLGMPTSYDDYRNIARTATNLTPGRPQYSDATLSILSVKNNPIMNFVFEDCFPVALSAIVFDVASSPETPIQIDASFQFKNYTMQRITT